jgi:hypothetical protein
MQWTLENGLISICHANIINQNRPQENVCGDTIRYRARVPRTTSNPNFRCMVRGRAATGAFLRPFVAGRQQAVASWSLSDIAAAEVAP